MGKTIMILVSGISLWLVALVVEIARSAPTDQIWICISGALLGVLGLIYSIRRLRRESRSRSKN
jgi:O-antigen/teichoic acid export membrane protein